MVEITHLMEDNKLDPICSLTLAFESEQVWDMTEIKSLNENADGNEVTVQASVLSDKRITRKCGVV